MTEPISRSSEVSYPLLVSVLVATALVGTVANVSVTVATSGIADEFGVSLQSVAVSVLSMNISMAFVMPLAGLIAGRIGLRETLIASGTVLIISTVVLMLADNLLWLTIGRLGQGAGLAGTTPTAVQAAGRLLDKERRSRALGWWSAANGAGLALGPVAGGTLLDLGGWQLVPLPTVFIAGSIVITALLGVPARVKQSSSFPLQGVVLLSLMAGTTVATLSALSNSAWVVASATGCALVALAVTAGWRNRKYGTFPMHWLQDVLVRRSSTGASMQMFANGLVQVTVPAWLISTSTTSAGIAGVVLLAMTVTMTVMGPFTGSRSYIPYSHWFHYGLILCAAGLFGLAWASGPGPWWIAFPLLLVTGLGAGSLLTPSFNTFTGTIAGGEGVGIAMYNVLRLSFFAIGGLVGAAAVGTGYTWAAFLTGGILCLLIAARARLSERVSETSRAAPPEPALRDDGQEKV